MTLKAKRGSFAWVVTGVVLLLVVLEAELALSIRLQSQTSDEACHLFAGYQYWKSLDFGINPEHPPLVKLVAAAPLLHLPLQTPRLAANDLAHFEFKAGRQFLYLNDADTMLFRSRMAVTIFALVLGILVFSVACTMFGPGPAFLALALFVFEPNILANGALVTTDMGVSCCLFLAAYMLYLYFCRKSILKLVAAGGAMGLALAAKHSGILVVPIFILLVLGELLRGWRSSPSLAPEGKVPAEDPGRQFFRVIYSLVIIGIIALLVLWSLYGFRFQARPTGLALNPPFTEYAESFHHSSRSRFVLEMVRWRTLPEAYMYGFVSIAKMRDASPTFLLGKMYSRSKWFFFPMAFAIKSSLTLLFLCAVLVFAKGIWRPEVRRELMFLTLPAASYFFVAIFSGINLGVRHILPIYPFLLVLVGYGAWSLSKLHRWMVYVIAALMVFQAVSSVRSFPDYLAYSNELFGGPSKTYTLLTDSNVDWGQGLKSLKRYVDQHQVKDCWFAYSFLTLADPAYYGIPCKLLPSSLSRYQTLVDIVPEKIEGTIFISADELTGRLWGPGNRNPYKSFQQIRPAAIVGDSILVFEGQFDVPFASAASHEIKSVQLLRNNNLNEALVEAQAAVGLAPESANANATLGDVLLQLKRDAEAKKAHQKADALVEASNLLYAN